MSFQVEFKFTTNMLEESKATKDDLEGLFKMKEDFIFVFSGFNERFLESVEVLDVNRSIWRKFEGICSHRTKF